MIHSSLLQAFTSMVKKYGLNKEGIVMNDTVKDIIRGTVMLTISYAFNLHKLVLIYTSVFKQYLEQEYGIE